MNWGCPPSPPSEPAAFSRTAQQTSCLTCPPVHAPHQRAELAGPVGPESWTCLSGRWRGRGLLMKERYDEGPGGGNERAGGFCRGPRQFRELAGFSASGAAVCWAWPHRRHRVKSPTCPPLSGASPAPFLGTWTGLEGRIPLPPWEMGALKSWGTPTHPGTWHLRLLLNSLSVTGS